MKKLIKSSILGLTLTISLNANDCIVAKELNVKFKNASTIYSNTNEYQKIKDYASFLKQTGLFVLIEGHTSSLANAKYNYSLSKERAIKVKTTLISLGVNPANIKSIAYGESSPLYNNTTEESSAKNRRVRGEVFNNIEELNNYISAEKKRVSLIKYKEQ